MVWRNINRKSQVISLVKYGRKSAKILVLSCWTWINPAFSDSVDLDQLASEEANWSGSSLFVIKYVNFYQQSGSDNLIDWQLEVASWFIQQDKG